MNTPFLRNDHALRSKLLVLFAICCSSAAMPLTFTGTAVALPAISRTLGADPIALNWVTNAFMLTFGSTLMAFGALADNFGRKRIYGLGLCAFTLFSLVLPIAPNIVIFDILRALQGLGAAAAFSGGMASLAQEFDGAARMRAFSVVGASFGVGLAFGPILSGAMISAFGWPSIFLLVVALGLIALVVGLPIMKETRNPDAGALDWAGAILFTLALTCFTYGVLRAPGSGWSDIWVVGLLLAAALLLLAFYFTERSTARPMLDLTLFRYPRFVGVQLLAAAPAYAFVVLLVLLPIRFVGIEGMSETGAGVLMMALSGPLLVLPIVAGTLTRWLSPAAVCSGGLLISAVGLFWLGELPLGSAASVIAWPLFTIGVGISLPWGLMDGLAVSVVPRERAGMATGIFSTTRVAGEGVALAVVSAILSGFTKNLLGGADNALAAEAAQSLVTGDLRGAAKLLPDASIASLAQAYGDAFGSLLSLLTIITLMTAAIVMVFLRTNSPAEEDGGKIPSVADA